jgi:hypothetical protein
MAIDCRRCIEKGVHFACEHCNGKGEVGGPEPRTWAPHHPAYCIGCGAYIGRADAPCARCGDPGDLGREIL